MGDLINGLKGVSAGAVLGWIVAVVAAIKVVLQYMEKYRTVMNLNDEYREKIASDEERISTLENEVRAMKSDYEKMQEENRQSFTQINVKLDSLSTAIDGVLAYNKKRDMADLKEQIRDKYDVYHEKQSITKNEKESIMDLIGAYELAGGNNSFVHSLVLPEILGLPELD